MPKYWLITKDIKIYLWGVILFVSASFLIIKIVFVILLHLRTLEVNNEKLIS